MGQLSRDQVAARGIHGDGSENVADPVAVEGGIGFDDQQIGQCAPRRRRGGGEGEVSTDEAAVGGDQRVEEAGHEKGTPRRSASWAGRPGMKSTRAHRGTPSSGLRVRQAGAGGVGAA